MNTRAALYARTSGDDRNTDGRNLASQLEICREYAQSRGYTVVAELCEDERGASGTDYDLPKLQDALAMAREGTFDALVVRELDRLARSLAKQLFFETQFKQAGVAVEYALAKYEESPEGQLTKNVRAIIAEYERLKINERMVRGRRNKIKTGSVHVAGRPPYGYDLAEEDGKYHLTINESEAQVVRMIYGWYTEGDGESGVMGVSKIAHRLTDMGTPTFADRRPWQGVSKQRDRGTWARSTVIRMLKNATYAGVWHYGKDSDSGEFLEVEVPAIVSREVWEAAQAQRARNRTNAKRNRKYNYLIGRRVTCGRCNHKMLSHSASFPNRPQEVWDAIGELCSPSMQRA
jgi:site-specific DNA recombinase